MKPVTRTLLFVFLLLQSLNVCSQQPVLVVKSFEYIWQRDVGESQHVILPSDEKINGRIKNCFSTAIKNHLNVSWPEVSLSVKPLPFMKSVPKFKTQLKDKAPGNWYLFLQIFEKDDFSVLLKDDDVKYTQLNIKCLIVDGANDSVILKKDLTVHLSTLAAPPDQVQVSRLPAYPDSFVAAFDTIASELFQPEPLNSLSLHLKGACLFQNTEQSGKLIAKLLFNKDLLGIHHLTSPKFSFSTFVPKIEQTGVKRNTGGHLIGSAFTVLTGIGTSKYKSFKYKSDYQFNDQDSVYHILIGYEEVFIANRERVKNSDGSYSLENDGYKLCSRQADPELLNVVTFGRDTLATFQLKYLNGTVLPEGTNQMWDGTDPTTIVQIPPKWNNPSVEKEVAISGNIGGSSFTMKTLKGARVKEFYLKDQLTATIYGKNEPSSAFIYQPMTVRQLKFFTLLSSLPYSYFCQTSFN